MKSLFNSPVTNDNKITLLQLTDTHLFATAEKSLLGVNTCQSFSAVLEAISLQQQHFDLIVATGDIAQDQSVAAYRHFVEGINSLALPSVWLPGNHDFQAVMAPIFVEAGITAARQVLLGQHWQLILLDSQVEGAAHGELSEYQLGWLQCCLDDYPQREVLLLLHHPPAVTGSHWLDTIGLRNASMLAEIVEHYQQIRALLCGHIHQELDLEWHGARLLTTPSTCIQFKPHCTSFTLDRKPPGWRVVELYPDGLLTTRVHRLATSRFMPDMAANGY